MKFRIEVTFSGTASFEVEGKDEDDALEAAQNENWVEDYGDFQHVDWEAEEIPQLDDDEDKKTTTARSTK
jgi:hypothetical protein